jgi:glutathione peroxidase
MYLDRRRLLALLTAGLSSPALAASATKNGTAMSPVTAYAFSFAGLQGGSIRLADYAGKPIMVVNTASLCGYTPQYAGLQHLFERFHDRGFTIIGVPSNDFGGQEPGGATEISATANKRPRETPKWNFHKYLVGSDGYIAAVFPTETVPMDTRVIEAVAKELGRAA